MATNEPLLRRLAHVQAALKVPKGQTNSFGGYKYRNAEDILEAVKPLLADAELTLILTDELVQVGDRYYIKATAQLSSPDTAMYSAVGYAREEETKKGMDGSQITGASSSYARKYALNGLFLIDDTKDSDSTNTHDKSPQKPVSAPYKPPVTARDAQAKAAGLINPDSMKDLKDLLIEKELVGDKATKFVMFIIGKPKPESESEIQELIAALKVES